MAVPNTFASATTSIPLANLDANFAYYDAGFSLSGSAVTFAGSITLTTGTANGVPYLNASKVLTSGAVLTFDGTTLSSTKFAGALNGTVGATTANTGAFTTVTATGSIQGQAINAFKTNSNSGQYYHFDNATGNNFMGLDAANTVRIYAGGALSSTFTSTGLAVTGTLSATGTLSGGTSGTGYSFSGSAPATSLTLDSSGNLGIGTSSPGYKLSVNGASSGVVANIGYNGDAGTGLYVGVTHASNLVQLYATGTANKSMAFYTGSTEVMRYDTSGNLGLGVTPSAWDTVYKGLQLVNGGSVAAYTASVAPIIALSSNWYYNGGNKYVVTGPASQYVQNQGVHQWFNAASGTAGNPITFTQAMTLDASGNLMVGATSSSAIANKNIDVNGTGDAAFVLRVGGTTTSYLYSTAGTTILGTASSIPLVFQTAGAERMRLDSSGNLLVGTTTAGYANDNSIVLLAPNGYGIVNHPSGASSGSSYFAFGYNAAPIGSITQSGTTAVLYNLTSDQRLKENIQDAAPASVLIDAIQVRQFDWKSDGSHQRYGFIAQELVTVAPEAVHAPADPDEMMAVDYSKLVPLLVKEIQDLRARVAALEPSGFEHFGIPKL